MLKILIHYLESTFENDDTNDIFKDGIFKRNIHFEIFFCIVKIMRVITVQMRIKSAKIW